jgi:hypothetical protein
MIIREEMTARTKILSAHGHRDLLASVKSSDLISEAEAFLRYVSEYLKSSGTVLNHGETLAYGYWLTKFMNADEMLEVWEYNADATAFVPGVTRTVTFWRDQHRTCDRLQAKFEPPRPDQLVVISAGILEGDKDVQGVRYPSPEHMAGWWFTTSRFDGNTESLITTHAYHVTAARPELVHLIALPHGFRFDLSHGEDVWFDASVAAEEP